MRSNRLMELFATILAGVAHTAGTGCGAFGNCDPNEPHPESTQLSVSADGGILPSYDPVSLDASVAGNGSVDCAEVCQRYAQGIAGCGRLEFTGRCKVLSSDATTSTIECDMNSFAYCPMGNAVCGRRATFSPRMAARRRREPDRVRQVFSDMEALEAESVPAFLDLANALSVHRAPARLIARARRAAADEVRHARLMAGLAGRRAVVVNRACRSTGAPSLVDLIVDNAAEGCVRETFGALLACWQAKNAARRDVRAVMSAIALDETRHAALAWDIDAWASRSLDIASRRRAHAARRRAMRRLKRELRFEWPAFVRAEVGLPSRAQAEAMFLGLMATLWNRESNARKSAMLDDGIQ